jgi:hypothetical protein
LRTLGTPLKRGRALTLAEVQKGDHLALINETAAKLWPPGVDPIGKRMNVDLLLEAVSKCTSFRAPPSPLILPLSLFGHRPRTVLTVKGVRFAAPNNGAPLTAPGRSENAFQSRGKDPIEKPGAQHVAIPPKWYTFSPRPTIC